MYSIFWFRRDLRLTDNHGLYQALQSDKEVLPIFIFDTEILDSLPKDDARVTFIFERLQALRKELQEKAGSAIAIFQGTPKEVFKQIVKDYKISSVFTNHDYEPYAIKRDQYIADFLQTQGVTLHTFKDQVIFEKNEVVKDDGSPYLVYTPYMKKWRSIFTEKQCKSYPSENHLNKLYKNSRLPNLSLSDLGFTKSNIVIEDYNIHKNTLTKYPETRDFPSKDATTYLSPHLRFGTVSVRALVAKGLKDKAKTFVNELIWREFFMNILYHYPETVTKSFKPEYDNIQWRNNKDEFEAWKKGETGYPMVDAGMRQLNETGYMHNRVRMVVGSFLCKHLLIDWRWGEAYFAEKLLDYEMSSNIGNWQWVAGTGVDAAPYFRIFNPTEQIKKFDKDLKYINTWVKDYNELSYPKPIVEHKFARERCLNAYKVALNKD